MNLLNNEAGTDRVSIARRSIAHLPNGCLEEIDRSKTVMKRRTPAESASIRQPDFYEQIIVVLPLISFEAVHASLLKLLTPFPAQPFVFGDPMLRWVIGSTGLKLL
jgi:hypothetical protein